MNAERPVNEPRAPAKAEPGLSLQDMKLFVRNHFEDFVNRKMSDVAFANFSEDFVDHDEPVGVAVGPQAAKSMMEDVYRKWPDIHVTINDIVAEGDKVMVRNSWRGTEKETQKSFEFHGFVLWRFANKKIVERWATITPPTQV
jgi:predicted ester cyclase